MGLQDIMIKLKDKKMIEICKNSGIQHLGLFGSFSRGDFTESSDIDLLYDYNPILVKNDWGIFEIYDILEKTLGRKIDLVSRKTLLPNIKNSILTDYKKIF